MPVSENLILKLVHQLEQLTEELNRDIQLAKTREEHVRVTARANSASHLLSDMKKFFSEDGER